MQVIRSIFYILFSTLLIAIYLVRKSNRSEYYVTLCIVLFTALFFINYLIDFIKPPYPYYWNHKKIIDEVFAGKNTNAKLFSADDFSGEMTKFFLSYHTGTFAFFQWIQLEQSPVITCIIYL